MSDTRLLQEAIELMQSNLREPLLTGEIAAYLHVTPKKLENVFRRLGHPLPTRFYLCLRLEHARALLRTSALSIQTVGSRCGFSSPSHFSRSYRAYAGCTPREERKRNCERCNSSRVAKPVVTDRKISNKLIAEARL